MVGKAKIESDPVHYSADIQFRDFRRTCVVTMGQRGIPDHLISAITVGAEALRALDAAALGA